MWKKLNFWSKSYPNPTPFLGQYDSNHVQCGYVLVQYGHVLSLHLLSKLASLALRAMRCCRRLASAPGAARLVLTRKASRLIN